MQHAYTYELYQPLLAIAMGSKSETLKAMAFETTNMLAFLLRDQKNQFNKLTVFQTEDSASKQLFEKLFAELGE